jgi:hypothetical protein
MHLVVMEMLQPGVGRVMIFMLMLMAVLMIVVVMIMVVMIMAAIWTAFMIMAVMRIVMIVTRLLGFEERRLDLQNPVEIEGVALQNRLQGNVRLHRAMQSGVGIDRADAAFDFRELIG